LKHTTICWTAFLVLGPGVCPSIADDLATALVDNWHQWRGPLANGSAPHGDPPTRWAEGVNVAWKTEILGRGTSTPIVWQDQIFLLTAVDTGRPARAGDVFTPDARFEKKTKPPTTIHQFRVLCLDRRTGAILWQQTAAERVPHEGHHPTHSYAAGSPMTDGKSLYASFGSFGISCRDLHGNPRWQRDLGRMNTRFGWGEASSPVVHGDTLFVNWDQEADSMLYALDAGTGTTRWKVSRDEPTSWATPLFVEHKGRGQLIVHGTNRVRSYDPATGEVLWQCGGQTLNAIPSLIQYHDTVICMSGYKGSTCQAIPLDVRGDITDENKLAWKHTRGTPYVPSPLLAGDRLYFTQENNALLTCLDARTGQVTFDRERLPGLSTLYASPTAAAGRIYIADREGTTLVLKQGDKVEVLATNRLDETIDASPVIVGKQLFLRTEKHLYCIEEK
jgi:outer membrane protein assembly factor BamB